MMISRLNLSRSSVLVLLCLVVSCRACADAPRVVIVAVPGLTAADLNVLDSDSRVPKLSAVGWMLCRTARTADRSEPISAQFLTLGSGSRAAIPNTALSEGVLPLDSVHKVGEGGRLAPALLAQIRTANADLDHSVSIGALGDLLHRAGKHTALIGDLETLQADVSPFLCLMDSGGKIDQWIPQIAVHNAQEFSYGIANSISNLAAHTTSDLSVIVFGDLDRADRYTHFCLPEAAARHRRTALNRLSALLRMIRPNADTQDDTKLILLSPTPADSITDRFDKITPLRIYGGESGVLTSASTRRIGLVLNTDLLPSIATWLSLPIPKNTLGRPITVLNSPLTLSTETALHIRFTETARKQNIFGGLPTVQLFLIVAAVIAVSRKKFALARGLATNVMALPLLLLLLPIFAPQSVMLSGFLLAALLLLFMFAGTRKFTAVTVCALLVSGVMLDLLRGSPLLKQAWMSYSMMEGARFYGIGNEYMGAVIGAFCALVGMAKSEAKRVLWAILLLFGAATLIMGLPQFGAKVGAIPSAGAALGVMLMMQKSGKVQFKHLALLLGSLVCGLVLLALWDMRHSAEGQSHFARAVAGSGGGTLIQIGVRKLTMEGTLLLRSPWSLTLWASAFGFVFLRSRLPNLTQNQCIACSGIVAGAVASLLVNDAGVLASALILLYGTAFLCLVNASETSQQSEADRDSH